MFSGFPVPVMVAPGTRWPVPLAAAYNMGNADSLSRRGPAPSVHAVVCIPGSSLIPW